jgi:3-phosphoglycerate kinase
MRDVNSMESPLNAHPSGLDVDNAEAAANEEAGADPSGEASDQPAIPEDHYILAYGPKTVKAIQSAIRLSFKLFWDGSISMFKDTVLSSKNNKDVLNELLLMRRKTNEDEDPPITLLHGQETEKLLRSTLTRIKIDEQEALDAKKRALEEQVPEEEDEMEMEDEGMDLGDESEEKLTTFQEDLQIITDLSCFSSSEFTTKIMQGVKLRCMLSFDEHQKPSKE